MYVRSNIAVVFPGQGSQELNMAEVWNSHDTGQAVLTEASVSIGTNIVLGCRDEELLKSTEFVQPALLACEVAAFRVIDREVDIAIGATAGHSLGQFASLVAAEVISLSDALDVVKVRGQSMQKAGIDHPGTMMALLGQIDEESAQLLCDDAAEGEELVIANYNGPGQLVISGTVSSISRAIALSKERGIRGRQLLVAGAFHSELMRSAAEPINDKLRDIEFRDPLFPIADNVTGELTDDPEVLRRNLENHVISAVRWDESVRALGRAGITTYLEMGPGKVLSGLINRIAKSEESMVDIRCVPVNSPDSVRSII